MANAYSQGRNPFHDRTLFKGEVLWENRDWWVFEPPGSYNRHQAKLAHKFIIALKHISPEKPLKTIPGPAWASLPEALEAIGFNDFEQEGGCFYWRFGPMIMNGGTVIDAPHINIDVPSGLGEIRPPIYKTKEGWEKDLGRFRGYWSVYKPGMSRETFLVAYQSMMP